jgi:hypothetical protein
MIKLGNDPSSEATILIQIGEVALGKAGKSACEKKL